MFYPMKISSRERVGLSAILLFASLLLSLDIVDDLSHGFSWWHVIEEGILFLLAFGGLTFLWAKYRYAREENQRILGEMTRMRKDLAEYKAETAHLIRGINEKVQLRLTAWGLSPAEKEICLLLLKGLATKEIAYIRNTSEKTITQQLSSVYQKSGLAGRSELQAFFLEDIFLPE